MGIFTSFQLRSRDAETRARAARKLGIAGRTGAIEALGQLLNDEDLRVRSAAVEALGTIGGPRVAPLLLGALRSAGETRADSEGTALRDRLVDALASVGEPALAGLVEAVHDRQPSVREAAARVLGRIGGKEGIEALGGALSDDRSNVRQAAAAGLALAGGPTALRALQAALAHKDPATRRAGAEALGRLEDPAAVPALVRTMSDRERAVREAAAAALAAARTPDAMEALLSSLRSEDRETRQVAAGALRSANWTPTTAEGRAASAVLRGDYMAAAAEGQISSDYLAAALSEKDAAARRGAAEALCRVPEPKAAASLAAMLSDTDPGARDAAVRALAAIGLPAVPPLLDSLEDRSPTTRAAASSAIAQIGEDHAAEALVAQLSSGERAAHGGLEFLVVRSLESLDEARHAADVLERLLAHAARRLAPSRLQELSRLADVLLVRPGEVPGEGDSVSLELARNAAARELSRRG
jgi:HEAT repeat protein